MNTLSKTIALEGLGQGVTLVDNIARRRVFVKPFALPLHSILQCIPPPKQKCIGSGKAKGGPASPRAGRAPRLCEVRES